MAGQQAIEERKIDSQQFMADGNACPTLPPRPQSFFRRKTQSHCCRRPIDQFSEAAGIGPGASEAPRCGARQQTHVAKAARFRLSRMTFTDPRFRGTIPHPPPLAGGPFSRKRQGGAPTTHFKRRGSG